MGNFAEANSDEGHVDEGQDGIDEDANKSGECEDADVITYLLCELGRCTQRAVLVIARTARLACGGGGHDGPRLFLRRH